MAFTTRTNSIQLEQLDTRDVPTATATNFIVPTPTETTTPGPRRFAVGSNAGQVGTVAVFDTATNARVSTITPFGTGFTGGVNVASGDLTGDGIDDTVTATASGAPKIRIYDGVTGKLIADANPSGDTNNMGCSVAVGDVTGDGRADLIVGDGGRGRVSVVSGVFVKPFAGRPTWVLPPAFGFSAGIEGGVRVAAGDVNGDGVADIVVSSASGTNPIVRVYQSRGAWDQAKYTNGPTYDVTNLTVGGSTGTGGVYLAAGDFDRDGKADVAISSVTNGRATVTVFKGGNLSTRLMTAVGFNSTTNGGVPVAIKDGIAAGQTGLVTGGSNVRVYNVQGQLLRSFSAFDTTLGNGAFVG